MAVRYDIAVGLTKGHKTTKIRRVTYKGDKKVKGLKGTNVKNVSSIDYLRCDVLCTKESICYVHEHNLKLNAFLLHFPMMFFF